MQCSWVGWNPEYGIGNPDASISGGACYKLTDARVVGVQVLRRHELRDERTLAHSRTSQHQDPGMVK